MEDAWRTIEADPGIELEILKRIRIREEARNTRLAKELNQGVMAT